MNTRIFGIGTCIVMLPLLAPAENERPIMKEPQTNLVNCIESVARGNVAAARVNVTHDAAQKRVRVFAVKLGKKTGNFKESGYNIEIIYNVEIAAEAKVGVVSYHFQHNSQVLAFAAVQFASGKKVLGRRLVRFLAEAQPDLFWSSPSHPVMTIQQILAGLEKDNESVEEFLRDESEVWADIVNIYGPPRNPSSNEGAERDRSRKMEST